MQARAHFILKKHVILLKNRSLLAFNFLFSTIFIIFAA